MHYYKFNISDWVVATSHLSLVEEAIYFRLINFYHDTEKPIPLETHSVFRRLRIGCESDIANSILEEFFIKTDKGWLHERCEKDLKEYRKTAKKNKANGAKGGRPKKIKASEQTQGKPNGLPNESQKNPNQEPLTINQEPLTNIEGWQAPEGLNLNAWNEFEVHRKQMNKPLSDLARTKAANQIKHLTHDEQQAVIDVSIQSRWTGLFPKKSSTPAQSQKNYVPSIMPGPGGN